MVISGILAAIVWVFVQGVDRLLSWQTLQRPLVTAMLTGLAFGDIQTGIVMGAALEAIFMGISAIGGTIPADACSASIISVSMAVLTNANMTTGIALALPIGTLLATTGSVWKIFLSSLAPYWEKLAQSGNDKKFLHTLIFFGIIVDRLPQTIIIFASVAFGVSGLEYAINYLPVWVMSGFDAAAGMMTAVGFAILAAMIWDKIFIGFFFIGFVLAQYFKLDTVAIAIIMGVVSLMYFVNDKKILDSRSETKRGITDNNKDEDFFDE